MNGESEDENCPRPHNGSVKQSEESVEENVICVSCSGAFTTFTFKLMPHAAAAVRDADDKRSNALVACRAKAVAGDGSIAVLKIVTAKSK